MTGQHDPGVALRAPHTVAFSYERSVGGATEHFLRGLARAEVWGSRMPDGRVVVPPIDHDPTTGAPNEAFVRVGNAGVVRTWTWVADADDEQPLARPFAYALVQLDDADTSMLHVVDVAAEREMVTGMRVRADWRNQRVGAVGDLRAFVPEGSVGTRVSPREEPVDVTVVSDVHVHYTFEPGLVPSSFYRALGEGRIEGGRCATCAKVFVPPHDRCPVCGTGPMQPVALGGEGTVVSFAVVHLPVHGMDLELPFGWAWIRLDGADVPFAHLIGEVETDDIRVGQRVETVWEREPPSSWEAIRYFRPLQT